MEKGRNYTRLIVAILEYLLFIGIIIVVIGLVVGGLIIIFGGNIPPAGLLFCSTAFKPRNQTRTTRNSR